MRTIGRHISGAATANDYICNCSYCGVPFCRSQLVRDGANYLACPQDARFRDVVTLQKGNAAGARRPRVNIVPQDGGQYVLGPINTGDEE